MNYLEKTNYALSTPSEKRTEEQKRIVKIVESQITFKQVFGEAPTTKHNET